jgi:hypothetical protein
VWALKSVHDSVALTVAVDMLPAHVESPCYRFELKEKCAESRWTASGQHSSGMPSMSPMMLLPYPPRTAIRNNLKDASPQAVRTTLSASPPPPPPISSPSPPPSPAGLPLSTALPRLQDEAREDTNNNKRKRRNTMRYQEAVEKHSLLRRRKK